MQNLPCRNIWSADKPVEVLNEHLLLLVGRFVPTNFIRVSNKVKHWFDGPVIALGLSVKSLSVVKWELMRPTQRPSASLVPETWMFLWMPSLLISGGPLLSLLCTAWVRHCRPLLVEAVDWCSSRLPKLICSRIILMPSSPGRLLICRSLAIRLRDLPSLPSGWVRSGVSCYTWTLMGALTHFICFLFFLKKNFDWVCFPACWREANVTPIPKGSHGYIHSQLSFFSHTLPNSLASLHNFSSESATCDVSSQNNNWFISNLPHTQPLQPFPLYPSIHRSNHTINLTPKETSYSLVSIHH